MGVGGQTTLPPAALRLWHACQAEEHTVHAAPRYATLWGGAACAACLPCTVLGSCCRMRGRA